MHAWYYRMLDHLRIWAVNHCIMWMCRILWPGQAYEVKRRYYNGMLDKVEIGLKRDHDRKVQ